MKFTYCPYWIIALSMVLIFGLIGCGCPDFNTESTVEPRVRSNTLLRFEPTLDASGRPIPSYNPATFLFPADINSSGSSPNDFRVSNGRQIILGTESYMENGLDYTAKLVTQFPTNDTLSGDFMVVSTDFVNRTACLRVAGSLALIARGFGSASARDFADDIRSRINPAPGQRTAWETAAKPFGNGAPGIVLCSNGITNTRIIIDSAEVDVTARHTVPANVAVRLQALQIAQSVDIEVRPGDIYYYVAKNGAKFAVLIEEIFKGALPPNLERVAIKFTEVTGPSCQAP